MAQDQQANRTHRPKKEKKQQNSGRGDLQARRSHDVKERRLHVPLVDRLPEDFPPLIVAVVGPPGVGKTTLIKSLIRRYTKNTLSQPVGPLTVVASKRRRLTFLECPADSLPAMIDVSKIADIVLLMIDGNYGFEMETMEFLNVLSSSGMPGNVFGILTHLDLYKKPNTLREAKKRLKNRFWSELYQGAKLFYLSGVINGRYPDREVHNLSRFISVMKKPRPLVWRNSHPYCLADRMVDLTPPTSIEQNPKCDRQIALYGYLRGTAFPSSDARVHIPGVGDLRVSSAEALTDPCPSPFMDQERAKASGQVGRKKLGEKHKVLYAPMSDVGGVVVDKDAVYIDLKSNTFDRDLDPDEGRALGEQMVVDLQGSRTGRGDTDTAAIRLFQTGNMLSAQDDGDTGRKHVRVGRAVDGDRVGDFDEKALESEEEEYVSEEDEDDDQDGDGAIENKRIGRSLRPDHEQSEDQSLGDVAFADSDSDLGSLSSEDDREVDSSAEDSDEDEDDLGELRWKERLEEVGAQAHGTNRRLRPSKLARMLYDDRLEPAEVVGQWLGTAAKQDNAADSEDVDGFFKRSAADLKEDVYEDRTIPMYDADALAQKWSEPDMMEKLRARFASSSISKGGAADGGDDEFDGIEDGSSSEGDGEFEDLEADQPSATPDSIQQDPNSIDIDAERERNAKRKEELRSQFEEEDREGFANDKANAVREAQEDYGADDWYDEQKARLQKQLDVNKAEFEQMDDLSRTRVEGLRAGTYARILLEDVPYEFVQGFNPRFPILIGGLAQNEERFGYVKVRIKRHRWHKKILKTNDPLIFSLGWRRFQTLPVYSISDSRTRNRMLKYTPEHMHCFGTFYGPWVSPNTGFCCVQTFSNSSPGFRIAATGVVLDVDEGSEIVKKLKLTGHPYKIFRNTAFIKDMFSSALEITKFEGASIRTVSGVRGQIKRALSKPDGHYRATFEDKILMSDIVFLRAWYPVRPHRFYNPVTNLLTMGAASTKPSEDAEQAEEEGEAKEEAWKGMRLTGEVRAAMNVPVPQQKNSQYRPIERPTRRFNPLRVPRQLAEDLPFRSQVVMQKKQRPDSYLKSRAVVTGGEEKKARALMSMVGALRKEKEQLRHQKKEEKRKEYRKKVAENAEKRAEREKRERDEYWKREGKKRKNDGAGGSGGKRRK